MSEQLHSWITIPALLLGLALTSGCATVSPALHVVGVYEGGPEPQANNVVTRTEASGSSSLKKSNDRMKLLEPRVIAPGAPKRGPTESTVEIAVTDASQPIVLALTAYDKTHWKIDALPEVVFEKIILGGYHSQRVSGIDPNVPIETYTYDSSPCQSCWQGSKYFYSYKNPPPELRQITGLKVSSFQGRYRASRFSIFPNMKMYDSE